jgi:hypothetical protein
MKEFFIDIGFIGVPMKDCLHFYLVNQPNCQAAFKTDNN